MYQKKILWVDDEIEMLRSHVIFLSEKGYIVDTVTNGEDAVSEVKENNYDLIFLDEMMAGMGGLETLSIIKEIKPNIPVVMITKSEEESLMNDALGSKISDYLIKPVLPSQVLMICKKMLEHKKITSEYVAKDYLQDFTDISRRLLDNIDADGWIDIYEKLINWSIELDKHTQVDLKQTLSEQYKECNQEFSKFVERNYVNWVKRMGEDNIPVLTPQIFDKYVVPHVKRNEGPVFFFVLDCMRADQLEVLQKTLFEYFHIEKDYYYSILPTATPYARNSLFAGLFPSEIEAYFPDLWMANRDDEKSQNKYEKELLQMQIDRKRIMLRNDLKYMKIIDPEVGKAFEQNIGSHKSTHLMAVVVNFLDMIAHGRSDSDILKEIAPDESAYRSLTSSWFRHSTLLGMLKTVGKMKNSTIIITTDHGSIRTLRGSKVLGDKDASTSLRFKFGRNLKAEDKHAVFVKNSDDYKLPKRGVTQNYIIAKEDYYFVYPTDYHKYLSYYKDTYQHGGISMEEMILPVITLKSK